ncbi:hypothetical protein D8M03_14840 [Lysinibacillus endophyticus]|uniref:Uncharacterized protein n=1 Tax=Ureibacillus endophyticus TaxID=1978490 RepID=A0A494YUZ4_9BACL|nr:hypothetical protein D8M03_14840 [Lysinibacillus endophyticus]
MNRQGMNYHFKIGNLLEEFKDFNDQFYYTLLAEDYLHKRDDICTNAIPN